MQFDLSLLPAGTTATQVSRAVLRLYVNRLDTPGLVNIQPLSGSWSESGVTSATLPPLASATGVFSVTQAGTFVAVDVTTLVQGWVTAPSSNHGLALTAATASLQLDSKENDQTAHPASLDVTITSQGPAGPAGLNGAAGSIGPAGPVGATGPAGPAGAPGASTLVGFVYQGPYSLTTNYALDDVVLFQGSSYVSLVAQNHANSPSSSPQQWGLLAQGTTSTSGSSPILYQGAYLPSQNYGLNDLVTYQGATYISLQTGNHGNLPSTNPVFWGVLGQGATGATGAQGTPGLVYQGIYSSVTNYGLGDVVTYQGSSYVSLIVANAGNTPSFSPSQWGLLAAGYAGATTTSVGNPTVAVSYQGVYASTANYALNDIVLYGASSYISLIAQNHGNTPGQSAAQWGLLAEGGTGIGPAGPSGATGPQGPQGVPGLGYAGSYASTTNYGLSDVVGYQGSSYISLLAQNHGNTPDQSPSQWGLLAQGGTGPVGPQGLPGLIYQGNYQSTTNYNLGDVVLWQGTTFTSLIAQNHGNTPDASPSQWGVLSARGPIGLTGATGAPGATGLQGLPGSVGPPGERGDQGLQGIAGQAGAQGLTGAMGAQGLQGPAGPQGVAGPVGLAFRGAYQSTVNYALADGVMYAGAGYVSLMDHNAGNTPGQSPAAWALFAAAGAAGATGSTGATGAIGALGPQGPAGPQGLQGVAGATGPQGPAVANYTGNYLSTTNYAMRDAVSYGGSTYVSLADGNHGNTPGLSPGAWAVLAGQGATGPQGPAGVQGAQGAAGAPGATGPQGAAGPPMRFAGGWLVGTAYPLGAGVSYGGSSYVALTANTGRQPDVSPQYWGLLAAAGASGPAGATGATGPTGPTGYPGPQGVAGTAGVTGPQGPIGPAGTPGAIGPSGPAGPQGVAGPVGLTYRGVYAAATTYAANDAATYAGSTYLSLAAANHGNEPDISPSRWALLAPAGATGATGSPGAVGAQGPSGPAGPFGAAGAAGTPGATGVMYRGAWSAVTSYQVRDAVLFGGTSYYATAATTGLEPDQYPAAWSVLAAGSVGPAGPSGVAATVTVGSVTTGAAGTRASITNTGTSSAAVFNFTIPQGVAGANGGGGGSGTAQPLSGIPFISTYHAVSYNAAYYSVNSSASAYTETPGVLTWVPGSCTANRIVVFSQQENPVTVSLRLGPTPGSMANAGLSCTVSQGNSCTGTASVAISAGSFVDLSVTGSSGSLAPVWTALECD